MKNLKMAVLPQEMSLIQEGIKKELFILRSSSKADELKNFGPFDLLEISAEKEKVTRQIVAINSVGPGYFRRYKKGVETRLTDWHYRIIFTEIIPEKPKENEDNTDSKPKTARAAKADEPAPTKA